MAEPHRSESGQVRVRGTQDGLVIQLPPEVPLPVLLSQVRSHIDSGGDFFRQAEIVLDYGTRVPNVEEIVALRALLAERGITLRTVTASVPAHRELLHTWGYHPLRLVSRDEGGDRDAPAAAEGERVALYVRRTLRSGASVQSDGDVVILGDVNAGAEVYAAGDVVVWGAIRGTVHAGIDGDPGAIICALRLMPTQLRIGRIFARPPDEQGARAEGPMLARIQDGEIVVESWRADRLSR
ncbi:septum site-determining protein MinC [Sphaerobacter sp.]|uniref:septum site-determining protein MinC n=1 Tax=Sphaerobacter sp. TaxID=2099654 RepID=UPI001D61D06D|nr:septum site-determining protein MinC [Sphaerobacter sp.]MBX5443876.1 septum site-determining protein MinC [Sphaerobacter sp.]